MKLIIERAPDPGMAALWALMYGTGVEVSVALQLLRRDIDESTWEIRARGTKTHTRDRIVLVAEWARPYITAQHQDNHARRPALARLHALDAAGRTRHRHKSSGAPRLPLRHSRHAWAVCAARAGTPVGLIAAQLGHASSQLTLTTYGRFLPQASDRALWERRAAERDVTDRASGTSVDRTHVEPPKSVAECWLTVRLSDEAEALYPRLRKA